MQTAIQTVLGLFGILLLFAPAFVLTYAAIKIGRVFGGTGAAFVAIGAALLTISSLDFLFTFVVALLGASELARFAIVSTYAFRAINYVALLAIGIGLLALSKRLPNDDSDKAGG